MKKEFRQISITFILLCMGTLLFSQVKMTSDIPNRDPNDPVYTLVEKMPQLTGGPENMQQYLEYYPYPNCGLKNKIEGKVILQFIVEKNGKISDIKVLRSPDQCLSDAAVSYLKGWPLWEPARHNDKIVSCLFILPIDYSIDQYNKRPK